MWCRGYVSRERLESHQGVEDPMQKRILVLGGGGFVGRRLVTALGAAEWATPIAGVRVLPVAAPKGIEHRILDATRESDLNQALTGVDAVVNCVAGNSASIIESA